MTAQTIAGWTVEYERPWWYASRPGRAPLQAATLAQITRMITRREV
jgi:hypothetical protein